MPPSLGIQEAQLLKYGQLRDTASLGHEAPAFFPSRLIRSQRAFPTKCPSPQLGEMHLTFNILSCSCPGADPAQTAEVMLSLLDPRSWELGTKSNNFLISLLWPFPPWRSFCSHAKVTAAWSLCVRRGATALPTVETEAWFRHCALPSVTELVDVRSRITVMMVMRVRVQECIFCAHSERSVNDPTIHKIIVEVLNMPAILMHFWELVLLLSPFDKFWNNLWVLKCFAPGHTANKGQIFESQVKSHRCHLQASTLKYPQHDYI